MFCFSGIKMTQYMDFMEFMDVLENSPMGPPKSNELQFQSNGLDIEEETSHDRTADLFSKMSDSEVINQFIRMRGIDCDQNHVSDDSPKAKKEKEEDIALLMSDKFLSCRIIPQFNPVYQLNSTVKPIKSCYIRKENNQLHIGDILKPKRGLPDIMQSTDCENTNLPLNSSLSDAKCGNLCLGKSADYPEEVEGRSACKDSAIGIDKKVGVHIFVKETNDLSKTPVSCNSKISQTATFVTNEESKTNFAIIKRKKRKPRTYKYNPKPLQHKINRAFVPEDLKDGEYWKRRKRNNEAAKKSREERRKKELEIIHNYEEMRNEFQKIKIENVRLKSRNAILEKQIEKLKFKK